MQKKAILLVVIVLVVAGGLFFFFQKKQSSPALTNNTEKGAQQSEEKYPQHIEAISGSDEAWYNIPVLGIRMKLNKDFEDDLEYISSNEKGTKGRVGDTAYFASKKLYDIAPNCAFGSIGNITIIQDELKNNETVPNTILPERIKSFPGFDVIFSGPTAPSEICWDPAQDNEGAIKKVFTEKKDSVLSGFKTLQLISSK